MVQITELTLSGDYGFLKTFSREEWKNTKNPYPIYTEIDEDGEPVSNWEYVDFYLEFDDKKKMWRIDQIARKRINDNTTDDSVQSFYIDEWENNIPEEVLEEICFEFELEEIRNMHEISDYYDDCILEFQQDPNNEGEELPEEIASLEKYFNFGK